MPGPIFTFLAMVPFVTAAAVAVTCVFLLHPVYAPYRGKRDADVTTDTDLVSQNFTGHEGRYFLDELNATLEGTEEGLDHQLARGTRDTKRTREGINGEIVDRFEGVKSARKRVEAQMDVTQNVRNVALGDVIETAKKQVSVGKGYLNDIDTEVDRRTLKNFERRGNDIWNRIKDV